MPELSEYLTWMLTLPKCSDIHEKGKNLLVSYGPEDLLTGIRRLDPEFKSMAERFAAEARNTVTKSHNNLKGD